LKDKGIEIDKTQLLLKLLLIKEIDPKKPYGLAALNLVYNRQLTFSSFSECQLVVANAIQEAREVDRLNIK